MLFFRENSCGTVEDCLSVDVRRWYRDGLLSGPRFFTWEWLYRDEFAASLHVSIDSSQLLFHFALQLPNGTQRL